MAVINKIRKYSWVAVAAIGLSIFAFVLSDLLGSRGLGFWTGGQDMNVGSMAGSKVSYKEFEGELNVLTQNFQMQSGRTPDETQMPQFREQAWNTLLFKRVYQPEFEKLGLSVSEKEVTQMVQGDSVFIHPWVRQQFTDPKTQKFSKQFVINYLQQLKQMGRQRPEQVLQWKNFVEEMKKNRLQTKYENLLKISNYVTKAEAELQYTSQNTKAEVKYFHVPFTSIADSVLASKVTDKELQAYLDKNKEKYKSEETRSLEYVAFEIKPSKEDSAAFGNEIRDLAREFAKSKEDSSFAQINSENPNPFAFQTVDQIPTVIFDKNPTILKGGVYGPYIDGKSYKIFKVADEQTDTTNTFVRASHILFKADKNMSDEDKAKARKQAEEILQNIKSGADFAAMAVQYGTDGTAQKGGDLGWFTKDKMVKPFADACFSANSIGLLPTLVITDFGYHIIQVTHPQLNKKYKIALIDKILDPTEKTSEAVLRKAEELRSKSKNTEELRKNVAKMPGVTLQKAEKLPTSATSLGTIQNAREAIRWAFKDETSQNAISEVFELRDQNYYVIATLTGKTRKDESTIENFREELKREVIKEMKIKQILARVDTKAKTLDDIAKKYGKEALVNTATDITLNNNVFHNTGFNPIAVGQASGLTKGKRSKAFADESGVFVVEVVNITPASVIADYSQYKTQLLQSQQSMASYKSAEALRKYAKIQDNRYKFY
jgi:peptidyl-prolyl cis-trans isomerase D